MADAQVSLLLKIQADLAELKSLRNEFGGFIEQIGQGNLLMSALGTGMAAGAGAGIGVAITRGLGGAIETIREAIGNVDKLAAEVEKVTASTGLSGSAYQVFSAVLRDANQDVGVLTPALSNLSKIIGGAGDASGAADKKLAGIGLTFKQLKGLSIAEQFEIVTKAISRLTDANQRDAASAEYFGRSYAALKPLIEAVARDGIGGLTRKVSEASGILSDQYVKAIEDAGDRSEQAGNRISVALAPVALTIKRMTADAKELFANVLSGNKPVERPKTQADYGANSAIEQARGKTADEIQELLSKELQAVELFVADDPYNEVIIARVKVFEQELAAAKAAALSTEESLVAASAKNDEKSFVEFEANFRKRLALENDIEQSRRRQAGQQVARDDKSANELRKIKYIADQAASGKALAVVETDIARIEADRFKTTAEKQNEIQPLLQKENDLIAERIALLSKEVSNPSSGLTQGERQQLQDRIDELEKDLSRVKVKQSSSATLGYGEQIGSSLTRLRDQWGTTSQQIAGFTTNTIGSAVDGVGDSIYGAITKTKSWGQVWLGVGASILQSLIRMGTQIVFNSALGLTAQKAQAASAATTGPAIATAYAPAAAATSISSYGSAAVVGAAAAGVAIGLIIAMLAKGGFAEGGRVSGPGTTTSDSIISRLSNHEYVLRADAAQAIGYERLDFMNQTGRIPAYAAGGMVNAMPSTQSPASQAHVPATRSGGNYLVYSEAELRRLIYQHGDFEANVIRINNKNSYRA